MTGPKLYSLAWRNLWRNKLRTALTLFAIAFGGFVLPPVLGAFVNAQGAPGYAAGFFVFVGLAGLAILLALLLRQTRGQRR